MSNEFETHFIRPTAFIVLASEGQQDQAVMTSISALDRSLDIGILVIDVQQANPIQLRGRSVMGTFLLNGLTEDHLAAAYPEVHITLINTMRTLKGKFLSVPTQVLAGIALPKG